MTIDAAYRLAGEALAAQLELPAERARARHLVAEERRRELELEKAAVFDAVERAASENRPAEQLSPRVLGITDREPIQAREPRTAFERETLGFRIAKARRHRVVAELRRQQAERLGERAVDLGVRLDGRYSAVIENEDADDAPELEQSDRVLSKLAELDAEREAARHAIGSAEWHEGRARGELERQARIDDCGLDHALMSCRPKRGGCGVAGIAQLCCGSKFCVRCRGKSAAIARMRFGRARWDRLQAMKKRGLLRRRRRGGRWSEKFLTVTIPHIGSWDELAPKTEPLRESLALLRGTVGEADSVVAARVWLAFEAWREFSKSWNAHWRREFSFKLERDGDELRPGRFAADWRSRHLIALHRSFEWTPAADGKGHPHFHCYVWSPYVDRELLDAWWSAALRKVGYAGLEEPIMPDVREIVSRPEEIAREIHKGAGHKLRFAPRAGAQDVFDYAVGWSLAEYAAGEGKASAAVVARLYEAITDRRLSQGSPGFLPARLQGCANCGRRACTTLEPIPRGMLDVGVQPSPAELAALAALLSRARASRTHNAGCPDSG